MEVLLELVTCKDMGHKPNFPFCNIMVLLQSLLQLGVFILFADPQHIAWPFRTILMSVLLAVAQTNFSYLLICLAHQGPMPRLLADILDHILDYFVVLLVVNLESETFTTFQYSLSQKRCLFPDTSCKDQRINLALQLEIIAANEAEDAVNEYFECQFASGI